MQTFWKSFKIWQSYKDFKGGNFFDTQCSGLLDLLMNVIYNNYLGSGS